MSCSCAGKGVWEFRGYIDFESGFQFQLKFEEHLSDVEMPFKVYGCSRCGQVQFFEDKDVMKKLEQQRYENVFVPRHTEKKIIHLFHS